MTLKDEITTKITKIFADKWETHDGTKVPEADNLRLGNDAVKMERARSSTQI